MQIILTDMDSPPRLTDSEQNKACRYQQDAEKRQPGPYRDAQKKQ